MNKLQGIFFKDFKTSFIPEILKEIYRDRIYAPYADNIKDGIVADFGGNVGLFTQFACETAKHVFVMEPSADHFATIEYMLKHNGITNVTPIKQALSHENGEADFFTNENVTMDSLFSNLSGNKPEPEKVQTITMDKFMEENKIDRINFAKIDIEGQEFAVLASEGFEKVADRIDALVVELHNWANISYSQAIACLEDNGFETTLIPSEATIYGARRI